MSREDFDAITELAQQIRTEVQASEKAAAREATRWFAYVAATRIMAVLSVVLVLAI